MNKKSRTENVSRNMYFSLLCQVVNLAMNFVSRTFFIQILGVEYLGVNGLFTNILTLLSFAELGIGNAIIFSMYKPLAKSDYKKLSLLMAFYRRTYHKIGGAVGILGVAVIPFLHLIVRDAPDITESLTLIYILFLANTTISYFFVYKKSIITADQKLYIVSLYGQMTRVIRTVIQIAFLLITGSYIIFLVLQLVFTFLENYILSKKADKMYTFLGEKEGDERLSKDERTGIFENVKALVMYKFGSAILNGTASIMISVLIGVSAVGIVSNYQLIIMAITILVGQVLSSFTASVGNLNAVESSERKEKVFNKIFFMVTWIYGYFGVGLLLFVNPLIYLWLGEGFVLSSLVVGSIVLHFYINSVHFPAYTYRVTAGLFVKGRYTPLAAAVINIVLGIALGRAIGLAGVFFGMSIARLITTNIVDPVLIFKYVFGKSPKRYFLKYFGYIGLFGLIYFGLRVPVEHLNISNIGILMVLAIMMTVIFNGLMVLIFRKTDNFIELMNTGKELLRKKRGSV